MKTAEEIFPVWKHKLEGKQTKRKKTLISDCVRCIVGEAWGWTDSYEDLCDGCSVCFDFCKLFYHTVTTKNKIRNGMEERYNEVEKQFVKHWNEKHGD